VKRIWDEWWPLLGAAVLLGSLAVMVAVQTTQGGGH